LTVTPARATIAAIERIHRLRGGVKLPTGGRLAPAGQPANPIGSDACGVASGWPTGPT
jgi:hypothetical protein